MDPTRYRVASHAVPIWEREVSFSEQMALQLSRAPWLFLSIAIHALAVVLLLLFAMAPPPKDEVSPVAVAPPPPIQQLDPPPEPDVPPEIETPVIEPELASVVPPQEPDYPHEAPPVDLPPAPSDPPYWISLPGAEGKSRGSVYEERGSRGGPDRPPEVPEVIDRGLKWLASHQDPDGRWDSDAFMKHDTKGEPCDGPGSAVHDVGNTALALLAFLADDNTLGHGQYRDTVRRGVNWLREQQAQNGRFGANASFDFIYDHTLAAYAMCEAAGLSNSTLLRQNAQAGIDYLETHRNPYGVWRYQPRDGDNDTSVTGWAVLAYKSAQYFGLGVNETALDNAASWLDDVTDGRGQVGYTKRGELSSRHPGDHASRFPPEKGRAMTAVGLMCRFFLGQDPTDQTVMARAADAILEHPPIWDEDAGTIDHYYWYYGSYALYQSGGRHWDEWSTHLTDAVARTQRRDGNSSGSWDPAGVWGEDGGRVYSTSMLVLTMQAYYRYTRLLR